MHPSLQGIRSEPPQLVPARRDDFEAVATLFAALHAYNASLNAQFALADDWQPLLREHFLRTHATDSALWLLAWYQQHPIGLLIVEQHLDSPLFRHRAWIELVALYVDPTYRGGGLAQRLLEEGRQWATRHGASHMQLYVTAHNERARALYRRCGWQPIQEIWCLTLSSEPPSHPFPADPSCTGELLNNGHHHLALKTHQQAAQHLTKDSSLDDPSQHAERNSYL